MQTAFLALIMIAVAVATVIMGRMVFGSGRNEKTPPREPQADSEAESGAVAAEPANTPAESTFVPPASDATWIDADASKVREALTAKKD